MKAAFVGSAYLAALAAFASTAHAGPDWQEQGDAGSLYGLAQETSGTGSINTISGTFSEGLVGPDLEDMYIINVVDPNAFSISVNSSSGPLGLFLFRPIPDTNQARGLIATISNGGTLPRSSNDFSEAGVSQPGLYAIAIAVQGRVPFSDGLIFNFTSPNEVSGPDGQGGPFAHAGWTGTPVGIVGSYTIELHGVGFAVPTPAATALLGLAGVLASRRRR